MWIRCSGNGAARQFQMDAYGYMLDALYFSTRHGESISRDMYYRFVKPLAGFIVDHWREPGNGIWEIRGKRQHYVETKAWCYAGLERAVDIARVSRREEDVPEWQKTMKEINPETLEFMGNFPQAFSHMGLIMAAFELDSA